MVTRFASCLAALAGELRRAPVPAPLEADFGGRPLPQGVALVQTESVLEVLQVLALAQQERIPVSARGAGHTSGGHTAAPGGIVLLHRPETDQAILEAGFVELPAHWSWSRAESYLRSKGLDLPVATSSLDTTVAGTLSAGGFGVRSIGLGPQIDHVRGLRLITVDGRVLWCSEAENSELFHAALTGLGQVGVVDRVSIATRPYHGHLAVSVETHSSFTEFAERMSWMADLETAVPEYFCALYKQGVLRSVLASSHPSEAEARRSHQRRWPSDTDAGQRQLLDTHTFERDEREMPLEYWRQCRNVWSDYCVEASSFKEFAAFVDAEVTNTLESHLAYVMCIAPRAGLPFALDMRPPSRRRVFSVGLFYSVPLGDEKSLKTAIRVHELALTRCSTLGGRPYLYGCWGGASGMSAASLEAVFGSSYTTLCALRQHVDPIGVLNASALNVRR